VRHRVSPYKTYNSILLLLWEEAYLYK